MFIDYGIFYKILSNNVIWQASYILSASFEYTGLMGLIPYPLCIFVYTKIAAIY